MYVQEKGRGVGKCGAALRGAERASHRNFSISACCCFCCDADEESVVGWGNATSSTMHGMAASGIGVSSLVASRGDEMM